MNSLFGSETGSPDEFGAAPVRREGKGQRDRDNREGGRKKRSVYDSDDDDDVEMDDRSKVVSVDPGVKNDISRQLEQYKQVSQHIDSVKECTSKLQELLLQDNKNSLEEKRRVLMRDADRALSTATSSAKAGKDLLEALKSENEAFSSIEDNKNSAREQIRENMYLTHAKKFQATMSEFSEARENFRSNISERMVRQTKIVDGGRHSEDEIRSMVDNGQIEDIIGKALHSERIENIVDDLRARNAEILKLQKSVQELYELFKDLHTLIQMQGETLNIVENRILSAKDYTEKGVKNLEEAQQHSKKARKCKCILLAVLVVILLAVSIPLIIKYGTKM